MTIEEKIAKRYEDGMPHHPEAIEIARAIDKYAPHLDIRFGGDGDEGEEILYALSQWIEDGKPDCVPDYCRKN